MSKEYLPYCYLIGWTKLNKWYYGAEYAKKTKIANPSNLWTEYFTSSPIVESFVKDYGKPDVINIRKIFKTQKETQEWETKVLKRLKLGKNSIWLNRATNSLPIGPRLGTTQSNETKRKISDKARSRNQTHRIGSTHSQESKKKMSISRKKYLSTDKGKKDIKRFTERIRNTPSRIGWTHNDSTKEKFKEQRANQIFITNGVDNRRVHISHQIETGWRRGKVPKSVSKLEILT